MLEAIGPTLVCTAITEQAGAAPAAARRRAHRSAEPRAGADDSAELAPAARRQHRRLPVPRARRFRRRRLAHACDEDPVPHRRRRRHVLRQLPARQRAGGGAARARPRRRADARLHADPHRRAQRQPAARSLFGGISVFLEQHASLFRHTPRLLDRLWDAEWVIKMASKRQIKVDPKSLGELTVSMLRGEHGFQRKEIDKLLEWLATERAVRRRQPAVHAADRPGRAAAARARRADLLHAAGRGSVPRRAGRAVPAAVARPDPRRQRARRRVPAGQPLLPRLHARLPRHPARRRCGSCRSAST